MGTDNQMNIIKNDLRMRQKYGHLEDELNRLPMEVSRNELIKLGIESCDVDKVASAFMIDLVD